MSSINPRPHGFLPLYLHRIATAEKPSDIVRQQLQLFIHSGLTELFDAIGCTQNQHHIDDVFGHTMAVLDATPKGYNVRLAALFHDMGKVKTRKVQEDGRVTFYGHEDVSAEIVHRVLNDVLEPTRVNRIATLVANHMNLKAAGNDGTGLTDRALQKLKLKFQDEQTFQDFLDLCHADNISHAPRSCMPNQVPAIRKRYEALPDFVPRNVHAKPIQLMFEHYNATPEGMQTRGLLMLSKHMPHQAVDFYLERIVDYFALENDVHVIPPDKYADYKKAFRSRAEPYAQHYLRYQEPQAQ